MNLADSMTGLTQKPRALWEGSSQTMRFAAVGGAAAVLLASM